MVAMVCLIDPKVGFPGRPYLSQAACISLFRFLLGPFPPVKNTNWFFMSGGTACFTLSHLWIQENSSLWRKTSQAPKAFWDLCLMTYIDRDRRRKREG